MKKSWATFEDRVRGIAEYIWDRPCKPARVGGVNLDGVVSLDPEVSCFIEITEQRTLGKVREDVQKLLTAKAAALASGRLARCFCVIDGPATPGMAEAGAPHHIRVLSIDEFSKMFFDYDRYFAARNMAQFGSAINQLTGAQDNTEYVAVKYLVDGRKAEASAAEIADWLFEGKKIVMLGEYGSGKSRCIQEVFRHASKKANEEFCYPIAIDLRKSWGLVRGAELVRRHFADLGLDNFQSSAIRALNVSSLAFLLDGFDEIGSQAWSNDATKLKAIRAKALEGVKDLVKTSKNGVLITGREHYFQNNAEMLSALGLAPSDTVIIRSKNEFSDSELLEYFHKRDINVDVPSWLPKRPLICQTISDLAEQDLEEMFGDEGDEIAFWNHFIKVLCERDAKIHVSFDPDAIFRLFVNLARMTRGKSANVGPISLAELQEAFEAAVGQTPVEEASAMLQRLPSLGRVTPESNDRQFIDVYILDGLRAKDIINLCASDDTSIEMVTTAVWTNPLDDLGQRLLRHDAKVGERRFIDVAERALRHNNKVLGSDIVGGLLRAPGSHIDFDSLEVSEGEFLVLDLTEKRVSNLSLKTCTVGSLFLPSPGATNVNLQDCMVSHVYGVTSESGLPPWIQKIHAEGFDSVQNVARIRKIGLSPAHEIMTTVIRKTFFQKGGGRKEEALVRGLGRIATPGLTTRILNLLISERILERFKGHEGWVYAPVRSNAARMQRLLDELKASEDDLWKKVGDL